MKFEDVVPLLLPNLSKDEISVIGEFYGSGSEEVVHRTKFGSKKKRVLPAHNSLFYLMITCACVVHSVLIFVAVYMVVFLQNPVFMCILGSLYAVGLCLGFRSAARSCFSSDLCAICVKT